MAPCSIEPTALSELTKFATWVHDHAQMEEVAKNTFKCVDKDRRDKLRPFLDAQKYSKIWVGKPIGILKWAVE